MPSVDVGKHLFIANALGRISSADAWEYLPVLSAALKKNRRDPLDVDAWQKVFVTAHMDRQNTMGKEVAGLPKAARTADKFLSWLSSELPGFIPIEDEARDYLKRDRGLTDAKRNETANTEWARNDIYNTYAPHAEGILAEIYDITKNSEAVRKEWDSFFGRDLGRASATPEQIVRENPGLLDVKLRLEQANTMEGARAAVKQQVDEQVPKVGEDAGVIPRLVERQPTTADQQLQQMVEEAAEARRERDADIRRQTNEAALRGALVIYSLLGGDKKTVRQLNAVLSAYSEARNIANAYNKALAAQANPGMATMALAGGWVGVAMALYSAFQDGEADAQEQMCEALRQISRQLEAIQKQLSAGFSAIDQRLSALSRQLGSGFEAVLIGLQSNQFSVQALLSATYGLAQNLNSSTDLILQKLDYVIDVPAREEVLAFASFRQNLDQFIPELEWHNAVESVRRIANRSKDPLHSGATFASLGDVQTWLKSKSAESAGEWRTNLNTYRSICRLLGAPIRDLPVANPAVWSFAAAACITIGASNIDPPSPMGPTLVSSLINDGSVLELELLALRTTSPGTVDSLDVLYEFLLGLYSDAMENVEAAVLAVHREKLLIAKSSGRGELPLGEYEIELASCKDLALDIGQQFVHPTLKEFGLAAKPTSSDKALVPIPKAPFGDPGWAGFDRIDGIAIPGLSECIPSSVRPEDWPEISDPSAWSALPPDRRMYGLLAQSLGVGTLSLEYQAQIDELTWDRKYPGLHGRPRIHYVLVLDSDAGRKAIAHVTQNVADSHMHLLRCYTDSATAYYYDVEPVVRLKESLFPTQASFVQQPTEDYSILEAKCRAAYHSIAADIRQELQVQLSNSVSRLGEAAQTLTRTTELIRGMSAWLLADQLETDAALRVALFGSTKLWAPTLPGFDVASWASSSLTEYPGVPLFDAATLQDLVAPNDEMDEIQDATTWPGCRLLNSTKTWRDLSIRPFRQALRSAKGRAKPTGYRLDWSPMLSELKLFQRLYPYTA